MQKTLFRVALAVTLMAGPTHLLADAPAPKRAEPSVEQRLEDLEAYVNNGNRGADNTNNVSSKLGAYDESTGRFTPNPGPAANAWQMVCAALVLFMTLPGLALFYGGLVRRKNVLSVMAQCMFITGMVTILWWACGYSLVFHDGRPFLGNLGFAFFNGVTSSPNGAYSPWVSQNVFAMYQTHVRRHHSGFDYRSHRRADQVFRHLPFYDFLDVRRLFSPGPHDLGR